MVISGTAVEGKIISLCVLSFGYLGGIPYLCYYFTIMRIFKFLNSCMHPVAMQKVCIITLLISTSTLLQAMEGITLDKGWRFKKGTELRTMNEGEQVDLPHSWNTADAMFGNTMYYRGMATYSREIDVAKSERRYFLKVKAAQTVAAVFVDNHFVMEHRGGYTAFVAEITRFVNMGGKHKIDIRVSNAATENL